MHGLIIYLLTSSFTVLGISARSYPPTTFDDLLKVEWEAFKFQHSKTYSNDVEDRFRMKIYLDNRQKIAQHNKNPAKGFKLKMNRFGDLLPSEFKSMMNGYNMELLPPTNVTSAAMFMPPQNYHDVPSSLDWREKGYVTPVKDQGNCGSCWAFAATGALEGQHKRQTGQLVSLSEQNLIDCSKAEGNRGCHAGVLPLAFLYIEHNHGIDTEESYPYEGRDDQQCRFEASNVGAEDKGFVYIGGGDEEALQMAVATVGPIAVAIDGSQPSFIHYESGIYYEESCSSSQLDHAVLVVGYGSENGKDFYLVKNSWGESWGEKGYVRMARNRDNNCGIASAASYPLV